MGFFDRIFGSSEGSPRPPRQGSPSTDEQALERYRYLLRTAPPDAIEQAHAEAFAQLTPDQRAQALRELRAELPPAERAAGPQQDDPQSLARMATRAEVRQPGTLERAFGRGGMGAMGGIGGSLLTSVAGGFIGSAIAHQLFGGFGDAGAADAGTGDAHASHAEEPAADDPGGGDDMGGDFGDFGE